LPYSWRSLVITFFSFSCSASCSTPRRVVRCPLACHLMCVASNSATVTTLDTPSTRRPVAALVLESSFTSLRAFAGRFYAPGFLVRDPFDNLDELQRYKGPLLVLHGRQDPIAPFAHGEALAAAVAGAEFLPMACGHNDCERPWPAVLSFLQRHQLLDSLPHD